MNFHTGTRRSFLILLILWISQCNGVSDKHNSFSNVDEKSGKGEEKMTNFHPGHFTTTIFPPAIPIRFTNKGETEITTLKNTHSTRVKRDTSQIRNSNVKTPSFKIPEIQHLFPSNVDNEALQKWLLLLTTRPKNVWVDEYDEYDDMDDDDSPAIDLVHGKKPGNLRPDGTDSKDAQAVGVWTTGADEPIVLHQHRMNKKSFASIPESFLREAASSSRTQPDPQFIRNFLARIINNRKPHRTLDEANSQLYSVGQLQEHSSRINEGIPSVSRLVL